MQFKGHETQLNRSEKKIRIGFELTQWESCTHLSCSCLLEIYMHRPLASAIQMFQVRSMLVDWTAPYFICISFINLSMCVRFYRHEVSTKRYTQNQKNKVALQKTSKTTPNNLRLILNVTSVNCVDANKTKTFSTILVINLFNLIRHLCELCENRRSHLRLAKNAKRPAERSQNNNNVHTDRFH